MNQHKPSQAHRIAALLDDYQPHCSNEMREMFIADPPRRINDLEEEGYIIKKEYCTMHSYHDGLPKMYTLISKPAFNSGREKTPPVEQRAVQEKTPIPEHPIALQPKARGYAYYPPEPPKVCCPIFKASEGRMHAMGCETQKEAA